MKSVACIPCIALAMLLLSLSLDAQDPAYVLSVTPQTGASGSVVTCTVRLDTTGGSAADGVSLGLCHDSTKLTAVAVNLNPDMEVIDGGAPPAFFSSDILADGVTFGMIVDFNLVNSIPPGDHGVIDVDYQLLAPDGSSALLTFCNNIGDPVVPTIVSVSGQDVIPTEESAYITIQEQVGIHTLSAGNGFGMAGATVDVPVTLDNPDPVDAFSFGLITVDDASFSVSSIDPGPDLQTLNGGMGPDFFLPSVWDGSSGGPSGGTVGCVVSIATPVDTIAPGVHEVAVFHYAISAGAPDGASTSLEFGSLGDPVVDTTIVVGLTNVTPVTNAGSISVLTPPSFIRGDSNLDGIVNITDPVNTARSILGIAAPLACMDAGDANDDGDLTLSDVSYTLYYLFTSGPPIPAPAGTCGQDPTDDALGCDFYPGC